MKLTRLCLKPKKLSKEASTLKQALKSELQKSTKIESSLASQVQPKTKESQQTTLKQLDDKYLQSEVKKTALQDPLYRLSPSLATKLEQSVEDLFFTSKEVDENQEPDVKNSLQVLESTELEQFDFQGMHGRKFTFEQDSLALKALQDGVVDFKDQRVEFQGAKLDLNNQNADLVEVDLGSLKSLDKSQVHIDDLNSGTTGLEKGQTLVDDQTSDSDYKLVMVGRKVTKEEQDQHYALDFSETQHQISNQVYHESGEQFDQTVLKDEGVFKHYLRQIYMPVFMILGTLIVTKAYQESFKIMDPYQDYLDWICCEQVKRGHRINTLNIALYQTDRYSVESRSN